MSLEGVDTDWLIPWADKFLGHVEPGQNPWTLVIPMLNDVFYPSVDKAFRPQLWFLLSVFIVSALIILAGLALRLAHGRLWIVHRIDGLVVIPNISVCYGLCALAYAVVGMVSIIQAIQISKGKNYDRSYVGLQGTWPGLLWLGMYAELWATYSAYYLRRYGTKGGRVKVFFAAIIPWIPLVVAIVPPAILFTLAARDFNESFDQFLAVRTRMLVKEAEWTPERGVDLANLATMVQPAAKLSQYLLDSFSYARIAFSYSAVVLVVTFCAYLVGAVVEIRFLQEQAAKLHFRQNVPVMRDRRKSEQMEEEWAAGVQKQARLLRWAARNRAWTVALIGLMLLESAALALWCAVAPRTLQSNSAQFHLVSAYLNGVLSTIVSLLILFRSLDGSSTAARKLRKVLPWLPLPPAVGLRKNEAQQTAQEAKPVSSKLVMNGDKEAGAHLPVMVQLEREKVGAEGGKEEEADKDWLRRGSDNSTLV